MAGEGARPARPPCSLTDSRLTRAAAGRVTDPRGLRRQHRRCLRLPAARAGRNRRDPGGGRPAAGAAHCLPLGHTTIGRGPPAAIAVADSTLPDAALGVDVDGRGQARLTVPGGVMALLDREVVTGTVAWPPGAQLAVGSSLLDLVAYEPPDAALQMSQDGAGFDFSRPPRELPPPRPTRFRLPAPSGRPSWRSGRSAAAAAPSTRGRRRGSSRTRGTPGRGTGAARAGCPDPATAADDRRRPRERLWERRRGDPDYLLLRVGTADLPSRWCSTTRPGTSTSARCLRIPDTPVTVPLASAGSSAWPAAAAAAGDRPLAGRPGGAAEPARRPGLRAHRLPAEDAWGWARWLPHARRPRARTPTR